MKSASSIRQLRRLRAVAPCCWRYSGAGQRSVGCDAVGRDEVDQRLPVLERELEVDPVRVRQQSPGRRWRRLELQLWVGPKYAADDSLRGGTPSLRPRARLSTGEVQRQAEQAVAHSFGHELVDLVADLPRAALEDRAGRLCRGERSSRPAVVELQRVEEPVEQRDVVDRTRSGSCARSFRSASSGRGDRPGARTRR